MRLFFAVLLFSLCMAAAAQKPEPVLPNGHTSYLTGLLFSPDGRSVLSASNDGTAKLWDAFSGRLKFNITGLSDDEEAVFTPDGRYILTYPGFIALSASVPRLWDAQNGSLVHSFTGHRKSIYFATFSPSGKYLVTCSNDKTASVWETATGRRLFTLDTFTYVPENAVFSADESRVAVHTADHGWENQFKVWNVKTGKKAFAYLMFRGPVGSLHFNPDGTRLLVSHYWYDEAIVYNTENGDELRAVKTNGNMRDTRFTPDGTKVVLTSAGGDIKICDANSGADTQLINAGGEVNKARLSADGNRIVCAVNDSTICSWDLQTGEMLFRSKITSRFLSSLSFSADEKLVFALSNNVSYTTLSVIDAHAGTLMYSDDKIQRYAADAQGKYLCCSYKNYAYNHPDLKLSEAATGRYVRTLGRRAEEPKEISYQPRDGMIVWKAENGMERVWDSKTGRQLNSFYNANFETLLAARKVKGIPYLVVNSKDKVKVMKAGQNVPLYERKIHEYDAVYGQFSSSGQYFATFSQDYAFYSDSVKIIETQTGRVVSTLNGVSWSTTGVHFSPDESKLYTWGFSEAIQVYDVATGNLDTIIDPQYSLIKNDTSNTDFAILNHYASPSAKFAVSGYHTGRRLHLWDLEKIAPIGYFTVDTAWGRLHDLGFSPGEDFIAATYYNNYHNSEHVILWKAGNEKPVLTIKNAQYFSFNPDNRWLCVISDSSAAVFDLATAKKKYSFISGKKIKFNEFAEWGKNGNSLVLQDAEGMVYLYDVSTGKNIKRYTLPGNVQAIDFSENKIISYKNSTLSFSKLSEGSTLADFTVFGGKDALKITPGGYYSIAPEDARLLGWKYKGKTYDFGRWDLQYNRPDLILTALGDSNTQEAQAGYYAYMRRVRKAGVDTAQFSRNFSLPEIMLINAKEIEGISSQKTIYLKIQAKETDQKSTLKNLFITVNGCPVYGVNGLGLNTNDTLLSLPINLSEGENNIKITCTNNHSAESLPAETFITYTAAKPARANVWYIGIGVSHYRNPAYNLRYATKDVRDIQSVFKEKYDAKTLLLTDSSATRENIFALKQKLIKESTEDDIVIISLSGHGLVDSSYEFYFATYDIDFKNPAVKGLSFNDIQWLTDSIPARRKLVLMDACHSGELDREETYKTAAGPANDNVKDIGRGNELLQDESAETSNSTHINTFSLMQELFTTTEMNNGATVISAAAGTQLAFEGNDWNNGVFTYCILRGLKEKLADKDGNGEVTVSELQNYVADTVEQLTGGRQRPTSRQRNFDADWVVWK